MNNKENIENLDNYIRAKDIMSKDIFVVDVNSNVQTAADLIIKYNTNCLIAMEKTNPKGMVTERDITRCVSEEKDLDETDIKEIMTTPLITVKNENSFFEVLRIVKRKKIKKLPVMKGREIVGIIRDEDIIRGIINIIKFLNKILRKGHISPKEHKKKETELLESEIIEGLKKEPPWVKKQFQILSEISKTQKEVIKKISGERKKYNLTEWKQKVWLGCKYKKSKTTEKEIIYICEKLDSYCVYGECPLNEIKK